MADTKEVLTFAVELGDKLLRNGAEVYRVEDSVLAILNAYDITNCDVYVLTNGIFASADENTESSSSIVRHVPLKPMHLGRISALNAICRDVCSKKITIEEGSKQVEAASKLPCYNKLMLVIATGIGSGGFSYLFGGSILDASIAVIIGFILELALLGMVKSKTSKAVTNVLGSALVSLFAITCYLIKLPVNYDKIIIGDIMPLVPGIAITNSIRDFLNGDYLSGTIRLIDALLTAFCIAVGVGLVITIVHLTTGGAF